MGWDITDFGSGNFLTRGLLLLCIRNGRLNDIGEIPRVAPGDHAPDLAHRLAQPRHGREPDGKHPVPRPHRHRHRRAGCRRRQGSDARVIRFRGQRASGCGDHLRLRLRASRRLRRGPRRAVAFAGCGTRHMLHNRIGPPLPRANRTREAGPAGHPVVARPGSPPADALSSQLARPAPTALNRCLCDRSA